VLCGPGEKARILVVEDDKDLARVIGEVFARDMVTVKLAILCRGPGRLLSFQPHLLVLDISLPTGTVSTWSIGCASTKTWRGCRWWFIPGANSPRRSAGSLRLAHTLLTKPVCNRRAGSSDFDDVAQFASDRGGLSA